MHNQSFKGDFRQASSQAYADPRLCAVEFSYTDPAIAMRRAKLITLVLAIMAATPVAAIAIWSIARTVAEFSDPCVTLGAKQLTATIGPEDSCRGVTVHSESKADSTIVASLVSGWLLASAALAVVGAVLSRRRVILAAGIGMLVETIVAFSIWPLTLVVGVSFLLIARRVQTIS